jgi:hypothetical protein
MQPPGILRGLAHPEQCPSVAGGDRGHQVAVGLEQKRCWRPTQGRLVDIGSVLDFATSASRHVDPPPKPGSRALDAAHSAAHVVMTRRPALRSKRGPIAAAHGERWRMARLLVGWQREHALCVSSEKQLESVIFEAETMQAVESLLVKEHWVVRSEHDLPPARP